MIGGLGALHLLLSPLYEGALSPEHRADLTKSGLTETTIRMHKLRSVPPDLIGRLLGFDPPEVRSAMLIPYPDPAGGFMDHIRVKVFPPFRDRRGHTTKYLQPKGAPPRLFFPLMTLGEVLNGDCPIWLLEGEKKGAAVAQLGLPAIGFAGIEGWRARGSRELLPDFDGIPLRGRVIELVPDSDWRTNPSVARGAKAFSEALETRGARVRLVDIPSKRADQVGVPR